MAKPAPISDDERDNFRRGYEAGLTISQIATALQEHGYPVRVYGSYVHIARDAGLQGVNHRFDPDRPWTRADDVALRTWISRGASPGRISANTYRTVAACKSRAAALGMFLPPYSRIPQGATQVEGPTRLPVSPPLTPALKLATCLAWGPATKPGHWSLGPSAAEARP